MKKIAKDFRVLIVIGVISLPIIGITSGYINLNNPAAWIHLGIKTVIRDQTSSIPKINLGRIAGRLRRPKVIFGGVAAGGVLAFNKIGDFIFKKKDEEDNL